MAITGRTIWTDACGHVYDIGRIENRAVAHLFDGFKQRVAPSSIERGVASLQCGHRQKATSCHVVGLQQSTGRLGQQDLIAMNHVSTNKVVLLFRLVESYCTRFVLSIENKLRPCSKDEYFLAKIIDGGSRLKPGTDIQQSWYRTKVKIMELLTKRMYVITPHAQTSHGGPYIRDERTSGATYLTTRPHHPVVHHGNMKITSGCRSNRSSN